MQIREVQGKKDIHTSTNKAVIRNPPVYLQCPVIRLNYSKEKLEMFPPRLTENEAASNAEERNLYFLCACFPNIKISSIALRKNVADKALL